MIINSLTDIKSSSLFFKLNNFINGSTIYVKLEGMNIAGSIKIKPAHWMINKLEQQNRLIKNTSVVLCSSSGNLGIALSIICKEKGYPFICVSDPNMPLLSEKYINIYGGKVIKVNERDSNGGYLQTRLKLIDKLLAENKNYVFIDQYANQESINAHYMSTGYEIISEFPNLDFLFVGAGTTGTLMGCKKLFKKYSPRTKIIGIDAFGSVTFGHPPAKRLIPGLGTSTKPQIADASEIDDILLVKEEDTIKMCHTLLNTTGLFLGGSSGTVLQGVKQYQNHIKPGSIAVAIAPDFGEKYLNTIYNFDWIKDNFAGCHTLREICYEF